MKREHVAAEAEEAIDEAAARLQREPVLFQLDLLLAAQLGLELLHLHLCRVLLAALCLLLLPLFFLDHVVATNGGDDEPARYKIARDASKVVRQGGADAEYQCV